MRSRIRGRVMIGAVAGALALAGCNSDDGSPEVASSHGSHHAAASDAHGSGTPAAPTSRSGPSACSNDVPTVDKAYAWGSQPPPVPTTHGKLSMRTGTSGPRVSGRSITVPIALQRRSTTYSPSLSDLEFGVIVDGKSYCRRGGIAPMLTPDGVTSYSVIALADEQPDPKKVTLVVLNSARKVVAAWKDGGENRTVAPPTSCTSTPTKPLKASATSAFGRAAPLKEPYSVSLTVQKPTRSGKPNTVSVKIRATSKIAGVLSPRNFAVTDGKGKLCPRLKDASGVDLPMVAGSSKPLEKELTFTVPEKVSVSDLKVYYVSTKETVVYR